MVPSRAIASWDRRLCWLALGAALVAAPPACAGQDEELVIPVAPNCDAASCTTLGGSGGGSGAGGSDAGGSDAGGDAGPTCSVPSSTAVAFSVESTSDSVTFSLFWVDYACKEVGQATIAPKTTHTGKSATGWMWRVRAPGGALVKEFVTGPGPNTVTVP